MSTFEIKADHTVRVVYAVEAATYGEALEKVQGQALFTSYCGEPETYGCDEYELERHGIRVLEQFCFESPSPTGHCKSWEGWMRGVVVDEEGEGGRGKDR